MRRPSPNPRYRLFVVSFDTDFLVFLVVFTVGRAMAEKGLSLLTLAAAGVGLSLSFGVMGLLCGRLSDRIGRKRMVVAATLAQVMSVAVCLCVKLEDGLPLFFAAYWLLGASSGMLYPALIAWLNQGEDATANRHGVSRTIILFCLAWNSGLMSGQVAAGWLFPFGREVPLQVALALSLINLGIVLTTREGPLSQKSETGGPAVPVQVPHPIAPAFFRLCWIANFGGAFAGGMVFFLLPDFMVSLDIPSEEHGMLLAIWRATAMGVYLLMHKVSFWHYRFSTAAGSQILAAVGLALVAGAHSSLPLAIGLVLVGQLAGYNYFASLYYSTAGSSDEQRGLAASLHEATLAIGMAGGTLGGGLIGTALGTRAPYLLAAATIAGLAVVQFAAYLRWLSPRQDRLSAETETEPLEA